MGARTASEGRVDGAEAVDMPGWPRGWRHRARGEIEVRQLVTAMRQAQPTRDIAELALSYRHDGVAGFDIAGPRHGYPPSRFLESFQLLRRQAPTTPFMPVSWWL